MDGLNKAQILGNLGADPELKMLPGGTAILKMRVATNESWIDKDKNKQERVEWHRVTVFGKRAEGLAKFVRKGMKVYVEGRLQTSTYEKEGQKHYGTEIIADQVLAFGTGRPAADGSSLAGSDAPFTPHAASNGAFSRAPSAGTTADIPF
ncbi:MAG: Single-stranded DNA-binding protein [Labilithrix sp.]|nr:Single-stranded DNA-binding protein [Labilithrix sp.]